MHLKWTWSDYFRFFEIMSSVNPTKKGNLQTVDYFKTPKLNEWELRLYTIIPLPLSLSFSTSK